HDELQANQRSAGRSDDDVEALPGGSRTRKFIHGMHQPSLQSAVSDRSFAPAATRARDVGINVTRSPEVYPVQQVGPQQLFASGLRARTNALANLSSTCGASRSMSTPLSVRNARASSIL